MGKEGKGHPRSPALVEEVEGRAPAWVTNKPRDRRRGLSAQAEGGCNRYSPPAKGRQTAISAQAGGSKRRYLDAAKEAGYCEHELTLSALVETKLESDAVGSKNPSNRSQPIDAHQYPTVYRIEEDASQGAAEKTTKCAQCTRIAPAESWQYDTRNPFVANFKSAVEDGTRLF